MLLAPYLKRWSYVRKAEQISGGHKYLPPRQDVNAPGGWMDGAGGRRGSEGGVEGGHCFATLTRHVRPAEYSPTHTHTLPLTHADLYIPLMAVWTYCVLMGVATLARSGPNGGGFKPETIYNSVRWAALLSGGAGGAGRRQAGGAWCGQPRRQSALFYGT